MSSFSAHLETIRSVFPDLPFSTVEHNQEGLTNDVLIVAGEIVCRFPRAQRDRQALAREARVLETISDRVPLAVPQLEHYSNEMACYRRLPGEPLRRDVLLSLGDTDRRIVLEQLGAFLRALHDIEIEDREGIGPSDAARSRDDWETLLVRLQREVFPLLMQYQRDAITSHFASLVSGALDIAHKPVVVHADLAPYHLLYNRETRRLVGVLDFGTAGLGDPAVDIAAIIYQYGESVLREVATSYPTLETCIDRARFWSGTFELQWALAGLAGNDRSLLVAHLGSARDARLIGAPLL